MIKYLPCKCEFAVLISGLIDRGCYPVFNFRIDGLQDKTSGSFPEELGWPCWARVKTCKGLIDCSYEIT